LIGVFTAFLTSFYMFRQWFMTFFGEYRGEAEDSHDGHSRAGAPAPHGHGGIHESPKIMVVPLAILAVLSIIGGWVGVPGSLGGSNHFDKFLAPVFHSTIPAVNGEHAQAGEMAPPEKETEGSEPQTGHGTELMFTGISVCAALLGFGLSWWLYYANPQRPAKIAHALGGFYETVVNKYYVDELYAALFVKPLIAGSTKILWHGVDQGVIDATLDNSAEGAREVSDRVRHMQSGNLRSYAGWIAAGAAVIILYMVWIGAR
jgi:NADH-quinone oxidoreductase subunit L